jgi:hypothetical protein
VALALAASATLAVPTALAAQEWNAPTALVAGSSTHESGIFTSPTGQMLLFYQTEERPTISAFETGGTLGPPVQLPPAPPFGAKGAPGRIDFLPNGDAVLSWETGGDLVLEYRFANGTLGPVLKPQAYSSFAVRADEVLVMESSVLGVSALSFAIGGDGTLSQVGAATMIYKGPSLFGLTWTALDADGRADVVINGDTEGILDVSRSPSGTWAVPKQLAPQTNNAAVAVAPAAAP